MPPPTLTVAPHPLLDVACFTTELPRPLVEHASSPALRALFTLSDGVPDGAPPAADDAVRAAVRALLRHGGFRPTGRSKPASEYLIKAVEQGWLGPDAGINLAVDACNAVSLRAALPISVVDLDLLTPPLSIHLADPGATYVFNPSGQTLDLAGLLVLADAAGPCGSPVKDSQRTKTHDGTTRTLTVIWGTTALPGRTAATLAWHRGLLHAHGAATSVVQLVSADDRRV